MDPDKLKKLRIAIINDDKMHSMADFFNEAVDNYLKKQKRGNENEQI